MKLELNGRAVIDAEIMGDTMGARFCKAKWQDTGECLNDTDLADLGEQNGFYLAAWGWGHIMDRLEKVFVPKKERKIGSEYHTDILNPSIFKEGADK